MSFNANGRAHRRCPLPARCAAVLALALGAGSTNTLAEDLWYNQPRVSVGTFYNDNVGLSTSNIESSAGVEGTASIRAGRRTETTDLALAGAVRARNYFDASNYNATDFLFNAYSAYQRDQDRFALDGSFDYLSTVESEVSTTGNFAPNNRQTRWSLTPSWSRPLTERANIEVVARYLDSSYKETISGLQDYWNLGGWVLGSYQWSEVTDATLRATFDHYEYRNIDNQSDSLGLSGGVRHQFSETLSGLVELGARYSQSEWSNQLGSFDGSSAGPLANLQIDWRRETGTVSAQLGRWLTPSGDGLLDTTRLQIDATERLSERWSLRGGVQAYRNRGDEEGLGYSTYRDRDYAAATLGFSYRLTPDWRLDGTYRFAWQEYDGADDSATQNAVYLNVSYTWPRELPPIYTGTR
jgi:hypothetical protein